MYNTTISIAKPLLLSRYGTIIFIILSPRTMGNDATAYATTEHDRYHIKEPLQKFLKEGNSKAFMEVLRYDEEYGTHAAVTKGIMLSTHVKTNPTIQKELTDALLGFELNSLHSPEDIRRVLSFVYFALADDKKKALSPNLHTLYQKRIQQFREGKFNALPLLAQSYILTQIIDSTSGFTEAELDELTELKIHHGQRRANVMYDFNTHKAIDFFIGTLHYNAGAIISQVTVLRCDEPTVQIDSINYLLSAYKDMFNAEHLE